MWVASTRLDEGENGDENKENREANGKAKQDFFHATFGVIAFAGTAKGTA